ncbi:Probable serine/threonine-protein kinase PIX13 [Linum perenne]
MGNCIATTPADPDNIPSTTTANNPEPTTASIDFARHINGSRSEISSTSETASCNNNGDVITTASPLPLKIFKLAELKIATRNFRADMVLGEGGFGTVYKGWIDEKSFAPSKVSVGFPVAVKRSNPGSSQGLEEWQCEVKFLGKFSHPNLVKLLGYCCCWEENKFLLVYEYMHKGSLEHHLFKITGGAEPLSWETRLKIAMGTAKGLAFLHSSEKSVIYRDFKASNILLDKDCHLYVKSDVYGFGVVLLEMLTGLRTVDTNRPSGEYKLVEWAKPSLSNKRKLKKLMDPRLEDQYPLNGALQAGELVLQCLETDPKSRPSMEHVLERLRKINEIKDKTEEGRYGGRGRRGRNGTDNYSYLDGPRAQHSGR